EGRSGARREAGLRAGASGRRSPGRLPAARRHQDHGVRRRQSAGGRGREQEALRGHLRPVRVRSRAVAFAGGDGFTILALVLFSVVLFSALPFARLVAAAFLPGGSFDPGPALAEIASRSAWRATLHSLETSLASTVIAT